MYREDEQQEQPYGSQHRADPGSSGQPSAVNRSDSSQRQGFAYQRSPSLGIRQPTIFKRSDSLDQPATAVQSTSGLPLPKFPTGGAAAAASTQPEAIMAPPQMVEERAPISFREPVEESLLATPSASEKKSMLNSLLSDDENSAASQFEPTNRMSAVTASGRKKANRTSMVALSVTAQKDNVKVVIRVRPVNEMEKAGGSAEKVKQCLVVERNEKIILDRGMDQKTFTFDYVATQDSEQHELFERIAKPIADSCLQGYNGTIFAYGQTGSGKTFTIQGPTMQINGEETLIGASASSGKMHDKRGIMQRSFEYIFDCMEREKMEAQKQGIEMQFLVKSSYLEIYNEQIMDLLDPQSYNLHVREDMKKGVYVEGLIEETVTGVKDMMNLTTRGARNRHVGSTLMNKESSRSHSVLTTTIESKTMNDDGVWQMKSSRFHIIDLAGSERSKNTKAVGERLKEAGMINKSLTALGIVINSLVEVSEGKKRHVHYRDSKLTFLLRDSLGGNSKTVIIANVTAATISVGETLSTLKFAQRAKLIKNKAVINEESSSTIHLLKQELRQVKKVLAESTNQLKIAHEQIDQLREAIPEVSNESMNEQQSIASSTICRVCKKDISEKDEDVSLQFVDTTSMYHSHTAGAMQGENLNDSSLLDLMNDKSPGGTAIGMGTLQQQNPKAFKMYRQRTHELASMKERVSKVEKLLAENLENMDIQQRQYEQQIETLTKSNKDKQTAMEASEKNRARDKMIIKFREERIADLEARLTKATDNSGQPENSSTPDSSEIASLRKQLEDAKREISQWLECAENNPQAAKLFSEKQELIAAKQALQSELNVSPESLTARIRGLNELTNNLNVYLKEYCMSEGFEKLKQELEASKDELAGKVVALETELQEKDANHADQLKTLSQEHEEKTATLNEKLEQLKLKFEFDRLKLEQDAQDQMAQLKTDLDQTLAEQKGELQKEVYAKVEAHEKQTQLQKSIDQLGKTLEEVSSQKVQLDSQIATEREARERAAEQHKQTEASLSETIEKLRDEVEDEKQQLGQQLKELKQKTNEEVQDLEKEVAATKEEGRMREEQNADLERKIRSIQEENDSLQKQVLETNEEIQEKRRHVREIENKLNQVINESTSKNEKVQELELKLTEAVAQHMVLETTCAQSSADKQSKEEQFTQLQIDFETSCESLKTANSLKEQVEGELFEVQKQFKLTKELEQNLSQQVQEKEIEISNLRANVTEKDLEMAKALREFGKTQEQLKQSITMEQTTATELRQQIGALEESIESQKVEAGSAKVELESKLEEMRTRVKTEQEGVVREAKKSELAKVRAEENIRAAERMVEEVKHEMKQETQNYKFELELKYQTLIQNKESEMRQTMATNQSKDQEIVMVQQQEIQQLRLELQKVKQARQKALLSLQGQVALLKTEHQELIQTLSKEMTWKRVGPKLNVITSLVDQVKLVSKEHAELQQFKNECQELQEQLTEYKGLTQQLQEEKRNLNAKLHENVQQVEIAKIQNEEIIESLNAQLQTTQTELAEAHQMLQQQKGVAEESITMLNQQKVEQFSKLSDESRQVICRLQEEAEQLRQSRSEAQNELLKYKSKTSEQSNLLLTSKETISNMVSKENQLMTDLKRKITELGEQQEQYKARVTQFKQEKEAITSKYETLKKENENLRELIKIKDGQIEDSRGYESERRGERERLYGDVRKQKEMLQKRENEIKELVLTLKAFADEKKRLEKELERMRTQEMSIGHNNQAQKIQHHLRIKEENNKLREENYGLQEQLRRVMMQQQPGSQAALNSNATFGSLTNEAIAQSQSQQVVMEIEKSKKEISSLHESIAKLAEGLLKLPGVGQFVSSNDQLATHFKKHALPQGTSSTSSSTYYATQKLKGTSEVIVHICKQLQARVQECNQMTQEFKRMEHEIHQLQVEKSLLLQASPQMASQLPPRIAAAQGGGGSSQQQTPNGSTMQPSFQVTQRSIQQQQQSMSTGQQAVSQQQPNQYRRQSSRGAPPQQSASKNNENVSSQPNLHARQMHLMNQQSINRM